MARADYDAAPSKQNLLIVCQYSKPPSMSGSVRQYEHARLLEESGWRTRIVASSWSRGLGKSARPLSLRNRRIDRVEEGVEYTWVYTVGHQENDWRRYLNILSFFLTSQIRVSKEDRPQVVLGSSPHLFAGLSAWLTARRYRVPFVLEVRDLWPESLTQLGLKNPILVKSLEILERFLYRNADSIVCLTDGIRNGVAKKISDPQKLHLVPNGVLVESVEPSKERQALREQYGWSDKFVVGWIGAHGPANHLQTIVEAARLLQESHEKDIHFVLLGDGPAKQKLVDSAHSLPNVQFINPVPKSRVLELLSAMDAGVIVHTDTPAVRGARPNKLFDYMAVGLPIISNLQGETQGLIDQAGCGITVQPMNPSALAEGVLQLESDRVWSKDLGAQGPPFLARTHDRRLLAQRLSTILDDQLKEGKTSGLSR